MQGMVKRETTLSILPQVERAAACANNHAQG
ncbi:Uncharacterised protein [Roseomonas gilardii subsp. rosea]|nr:Uncharacterised protein [Roseomonas gilardii subsp. rosea]